MEETGKKTNVRFEVHKRVYFCYSQPFVAESLCTNKEKIIFRFLFTLIKSQSLPLCISERYVPCSYLEWDDEVTEERFL